MKIVKENSIAKAGPSQSEKTRLISLDGSKYILPATVIDQVYDEATKKGLKRYSGRDKAKLWRRRKRWCA